MTIPQPESAPATTYYVYVAAQGAKLLQRIRFGPEGALVDQTTALGGENEGPRALRFSPNGEHLYVGTTGGDLTGELSKLVAGPDTLTAEPILLGLSPSAVEVSPDGIHAFVAGSSEDSGSSEILVVHTAAMTAMEPIRTCAQPQGALLNHAGTRLYTACSIDNQLVEVDPETLLVTRRLSLTPGAEVEIPLADWDAKLQSANTRPPEGNSPPRCSPTWSLPALDDTSIYVTCNEADQILEVDVVSWSVRRRFFSGRGPYQLAQTPDGRMLVVSLRQAGGVEFIDVASGVSLGTARSSAAGSHGVALSPDSRFAFVSVEGAEGEPGRVDIWDLRTLSRVASVEVGEGAAGIAFWKMEGAAAARR